MLIDGEKWACEACVRGHRVTTCKHNDRPLIRIARKGRPFSTCSVCNCTPCQAPEEHSKLRREADSKSQSSKKSSGRPSRPNSAFQPIAPRPSSIEPPTSAAAASHAVIPGLAPGTHPSAAGAVPAGPGSGPGPSPRPRSSTTGTGTGTQMGMSITSQPGHAHAHSRLPHHPHPSSRSTAPAGVPAPTPSHFPLTCSSFATPALASVADIPVSMPLMHGHSQGYLFPDGYAGDGVFSLDDLQGGMMQSEWGDQFWLGDDSV